MIAVQHHVAACGQGLLCTHEGRLVAAGALHRQIIREDQSAETELLAQNGLQKPRRVSGHLSVKALISHMRGHDAFEFERQTAIDRKITPNLRFRTIVGRAGNMAVGLSPAVTGEMFAAVGHTGEPQSGHERSGIAFDFIAVRSERAVPDHGGAPIVDVEHRCERHVDPRSAKFTREHVARGRQTCLSLITGRTAGSHRRHLGEPFAKALHPTALVIHGDQNPGTHGMNGAAKRTKHFRRCEVAGKENHRPGHRVFQPPNFVFSENGAGNIDHNRAERMCKSELLRRKHDGDSKR